ncbi:MAG: cell division protein FtsQ/DivIB [Rhodospirillales bacterium]
MSNANNKSPARRGQPRRRVVPLWRSRQALYLAAALMAGAAAGYGWWLWDSGWVMRAAGQAKWKAIAMTGDLGFTIKEIMVVGRKQTLREELLNAVRTARGAPILALDINDAKERIEKLPWVRSASVERMLPDTILLRVVERKPLAIWQNKGRFSLIDHEGKVILEKGIEPFSDMLVVVGEGAAAHAAELIKILKTQPQLMEMVKAAVRVGDRRWNVSLKNGIDVRLPENDPLSAWARLAEFEHRHKVLERDVKVLDLRLPDRLIVREIVRKPGRSGEKKNNAGQET